MTRWLWWVAAVAALATTTTTRGQHLENDLQNLLDNDIEADSDFEVELFFKPEDMEEVSSPRSSSSSSSSSYRKKEEGVRRLWGVADTQAHPGHLFSYPIPDDAFSGDVKKYQVKGLPEWLHWDSHRGVVEGVARGADRGHHYVTIRAHGHDGSTAKDVFAIEVVDIPGSSVARQFGCGPQEDLTMMSVVLDVHLPSLEAKSRARLLRSAIKYFRTKEITLLSAPHDFDPLADDGAILAGPGSATLGSGARRESVSQIHWIVGCDGEVSSTKQAEVDHVEAVAKSGELQEALKTPVLGWHVTQVNPKSKRVRRQAEYSGDDDYNYDYNYDYDYGEGDYLSEYDDYEPEARVIPSLATPVFPDTPATSYRPSPEVPSYVSPVLRPVPISTPVYVPVKPTRMLEASPTVTYESAYPTNYPDLEGSILTRPTHTMDATASLDIAPTRTLAPTSVPTVAVTTEIEVKNFSPQIKNRIPKLAWVAGNVYRMKIPIDTFEDVEDGNTRQLRLLFKNSRGEAIGRPSWILFDPTKQEIYALPLEKDIGRYVFLLEAMDSEGKSVTDSIFIHVQQSKESRNFNHHFTATFKKEKKYEYDFVYSLDWQIAAVEKIARFYGDPTTDNINVRLIEMEPIKMSWTNTSLTDSRSQTCPEEELNKLKEMMVSDDNDLTKAIKSAFQPEFHLKHIRMHLQGLCGHPKPGAPPPKPDVTFDNEGPIIRNHIDFLNATLGVLFRYKVPGDTCYDLEDGDSSRLNMRLLTTHLTPPAPTSWLQFDEANQEFFGIPLEGDVGKREYVLECVDSGGLKVNDALAIKVMAAAATKIPPANFSLTVDTDYRTFMANGYQKARLVGRIAQVFGDATTQHIVVESLRPGSVKIQWHNSSLPADPCPDREIQQLRKIMVDDNGNLNPEFKAAFSPEFKVTRGSVAPGGVCLAAATPTHPEVEVHQPHEEKSLKGDENDYLLNFIIPAVIIAAMLLLAAIIACCLYRRRRYGKMTMADDRTFVSKGIPIIFAEELDDRPDPAKSPIIMKDEKPPLPPPEYQRGSSPAASSTPPDRRRPLSSDPGDDTPSYQPPPPFTATNGASRHPRPNMPPTYRKPPTYVPP